MPVAVAAGASASSAEVPHLAAVPFGANLADALRAAAPGAPGGGDPSASATSVAVPPDCPLNLRVVKAKRQQLLAVALRTHSGPTRILPSMEILDDFLVHRILPPVQEHRAACLRALALLVQQGGAMHELQDFRVFDWRMISSHPMAPAPVLWD
ncbi:MAG: hypothetical protein GY772_20495, partial [bacterium]|nr:hypothetical protein [bacterium]